MNLIELIKTRKSVRTFDGRELSAEDRAKIQAYVKTISNPYGIPIEFILLDAKEHGLSSSVITGESLYIAAKVKKVPHDKEAYGFSFEKFVLYAWSLGIGTTWIAGTLDREIFDKAAQTNDDEFMYCVSPLGYPASKMSDIEIKLRAGVHGDERQSPEELFFDRDFSTPLAATDEKLNSALEAVRLAPSAANQQPWRIVKDGNNFHFYEQHSKLLASRTWDVQKIDMGIALCHFISIMDGKLIIENPGIVTPDSVDYIATISC